MDQDFPIPQKRVGLPSSVWPESMFTSHGTRKDREVPGVNVPLILDELLLCKSWQHLFMV